MKISLTGPQLQHLIDQFGLDIGLEDGIVTAARKDGRKLEPTTIAKMVGLKEVPENWYVGDYGEVRGL